MSDFDGKVKELITSSEFFQFSASWCPDCVYANSIWTKFHVSDKVTIFDIGSLPKEEQEQWRQAFQRVTGSRNLPTIFVNGVIWGTESELHKFENNGSIQQELEKINLL
ncbi:hypothetical protein TPHA_0B00950 [Tetrapisispora phaffii CBS 4417]|uniref:Glutaredoxin domain-containing protein n=1 Tax=Tetrapisispora phaffii (strain ATCC 24235 / CBS 4417 / NBRC 1672 / NRRL Y-8282 / UCD 70-5) TaxID=1071381 RepID=G8BQH0_TETPH|nr:hypothetical protein TPHA_0B00950 [Tetrapisispora phaffii CBS 4417]CCE61767.1 hypothetical protein TPHA_0B00950 [Tetrapisispora phaffii CBS 4417]